MIEVGRLCLKLAGRDSGKKCVIVEILDKNFVKIDGQTRRRKCNVLHIEPLKEVIKIKKGASHDEIKSEFKKLGIEIVDTTPKEKKQRPKKSRKERKIEEKQKTEIKKETKKKTDKKTKTKKSESDKKNKKEDNVE